MGVGEWGQEGPRADQQGRRGQLDRLLPLAPLLSYLPQVVPLAVFWDGLASMFRTYRVSELEAITEAIRRPGCQWRVAEIPVPGAPIPVTAVLGSPEGGPVG